MTLTRTQVDALLRPINPARVLRDNNGMSHVSQQDIRAHLTRVFGFGGWSTEVRDLALVAEVPVTTSKGKDAWEITYRALVRLTVRDPAGAVVASFEDVGTGTSPKLLTKGDAHDFACKVAVSIALKRCATNLGDGFGLSLYNKGQMSPLVIGTLVKPDGEEGSHDIQSDVPEQVSMGHDDEGSRTLDEHRQVTEALTKDQPRADRGALPVEQDQWTKPIETDAEWLKGWRKAVTKATPEELLTLWTDLGDHVKALTITEADREAAQTLWTQRRTVHQRTQAPAEQEPAA